MAVSDPAPIPMVMHCPRCSKQHVDEGTWATRVHRTHRCARCGWEWRPAQVPTIGVATLPARVGKGLARSAALGGSVEARLQDAQRAGCETIELRDLSDPRPGGKLVDFAVLGKSKHDPSICGCDGCRGVEIIGGPRPEEIELQEQLDATAAILQAQTERAEKAESAHRIARGLLETSEKLAVEAITRMRNAENQLRLVQADLDRLRFQQRRERVSMPHARIATSTLWKFHNFEWKATDFQAQVMAAELCRFTKNEDEYVFGRGVTGTPKLWEVAGGICECPLEWRSMMASKLLNLRRAQGRR